MNVEHCFFLSGFADRSQSHEQDGERLRANGLQTASGDPAMAFEPSVTGLRTLRVRQCPGSTCGRSGNDECDSYWSMVFPENR
jgi:hypothetical protein